MAPGRQDPGALFTEHSGHLLTHTPHLFSPAVPRGQGRQVPWAPAHSHPLPSSPPKCPGARGGRYLSLPWGRLSRAVLGRLCPPSHQHPLRKKPQAVRTSRQALGPGLCAEGATRESCSTSVPPAGALTSLLPSPQGLHPRSPTPSQPVSLPGLLSGLCVLNHPLPAAMLRPLSRLAPSLSTGSVSFILFKTETGNWAVC